MVSDGQAQPGFCTSALCGNPSLLFPHVLDSLDRVFGNFAATLGQTLFETRCLLGEI